MRKRAFAAALLAFALAARADEADTVGLVEESCRICHARELVDSQRLSAAQWRAEVEKMVRWGAPLQPEEIAPVAAYLAKVLGSDVPERPPPTVPVAAARGATRPEAERPPLHPRGSARRGASTYRTACASCHGDPPLGEKGPELVLRPVLDRPADFWQIVLEGRNRMPSFAGALPPGQLEDVYAHLRSLRELPLAPSVTRHGKPGPPAGRPRRDGPVVPAHP